MKMVKSLLLGTAAGLVAVAGAQAADMPVKAKPVQYVKICSLYGDGFYYIPGTDTCIKFGGFLRVQAEYNAGSGHIPVGSGSGPGFAIGGEAQQGQFTRNVTNDTNYRTRGALSTDVRQQTQYGTLRTYIRFGAENTTPPGGAAGPGGTVFFDRGFLQFAGFTVGKTQSFFDLYTYGGGQSYHNVRVNGDTGASGVTLWAYTAQFGNGVSGTVSAEDPTNHNRMPVIDLATPGGNFTTSSATGTTTDSRATTGPFLIGGYGGNDLAFSQQSAATNGFRTPDVVANLRVDQAWGFIGISAAAHEVGGAYWGGLACSQGGITTPPTVVAPPGAFQSPAGNCQNNGHPPDKVGWAIAVGGQLLLQGGDTFGIDAVYTEGAVGYATNANAWSRYNGGTSVGLAWATDGVFDTGTTLQLTRAWSAIMGYQHIWNPRWRSSLFGGYVSVDYNGAATAMINSRIVGCGGVPGTTLAGAGGGVVPPPGIGRNAGAATITAFNAGPGNACNPDYSHYEIGTRTQWNPTPQLDIGLQVLYTHLNTAYKGSAIVQPIGAKPTVFAIDDQNVWSVFFRWQRNFFP